MLKKIGKRVLQIGLPLVILAIIFYYARRDWGELTSYRFVWNPWLLALAFHSGSSRFKAGPAYLSTRLPGFGVCALYSRQCLACTDTNPVGRQIWCPAPYRFCQYDD